eukprot:CAMPEP_0114499998 /NCGR_PEP_ID=MMETSP0109-20121206/7721_1 /TAXON_ID=29199 /ORGANISM="Chlorarachnion reptans, Strain CCCM449" /LENGTH=94 /DNA_ID=CAMNT_0001677613 /DNA_START=117 /DNA_END=401 /DNA_ORIENTATION=+
MRTTGHFAATRPLDFHLGRDMQVEAFRGKAKTRKAAAKRYKVTSTGKVFTKMAGKQHLNTKMSRKQKLALSRKRQVEAADIPNVQACLPHVKVK